MYLGESENLNESTRREVKSLKAHGYGRETGSIMQFCCTNVTQNHNTYLDRKKTPALPVELV